MVTASKPQEAIVDFLVLQMFFSNLPDGWPEQDKERVFISAKFVCWPSYSKIAEQESNQVCYTTCLLTANQPISQVSDVKMLQAGWASKGEDS